MAWGAGWPPVAGTTKSKDYARLMELWESVRELNYPLGNDTIWPRENVAWSGCTITSLVDNEDGTWTLTDSSLAPAPTGPGTEPDDGYYWNGGRIFPPCCGHQHWVGVDCGACTPSPGQPYIPTFFDVIIQLTNGEEEWYRDQDPRAVIRGNVVGSTSQSITFEVKLANYVTAGMIPADPATSLIGAQVRLMKTGGLAWADKEFLFGRYPDYPNDNEEWRGTANSGKVYDDGTGYLIDLYNEITPSGIPGHNHWPAGMWTLDAEGEEQERELLVYDADGRLKRLTITSNGENVIFFGGLDHIPTEEEEEELTVEYEIETSAYSIGAPDFRCFPERKGWAVLWWYGGAFDTVYGHDPSDALATYSMNVAADYVEWDELESFDGDPPPVCGEGEGLHAEFDPMDRDLWTSITNLCSPADHCFSPQLPKSLRFIQVCIEEKVSSYIRPTDYTAAKEIPSYSIAQCFADADINHGATTVDVTLDSEGSPTEWTYHFTVAAEYAGWPVYWEAVKDGVRKGSGFSATDVTGKVIVAVLGAADPDWQDADVVYSAGWTRYHPQEFTHLYARGAWIPDVKPAEEGPGTVIWPAQVDDFCCEEEEEPPEECCHDCFGVGQWIWREASTGYKTFDQFGHVIEDSPAFVAGDVARYTGQNWHEPDSVGVAHESGDDTEDLMFWDRFFEGRHPPKIDVQQYLSRRGRITSATDHSFTDTDKHWWNGWYPTHNGTMRTESGVATGGSSTTLITTESLTDPEDEAHCMWQASRFIGSLFGGKPYKNFIYELEREEQQIALGGEPEYAGDGSPDPIGTYDAGDPMEDVNGDPIMVTNIYKYVVIDVTNNTEGNAPVLHFAAQNNLAGELIEIVDDDVWHIKEPATNLHCWRGRRVRFTRPDGTWFELDITHNDDQTGFFPKQTDPENIPQRGWFWRIIHYEPGGCWKFSTTPPTTEEKALNIKWQQIGTNAYWIQPYGADPRGATPDNDWHGPTHTRMTENLPHAVKKYGRRRKMDYRVDESYDEPYRMRNLLWKTKLGYQWTANGATDNLRAAGIEKGWSYNTTDYEAKQADGRIVFGDVWDDPDFVPGAPFFWTVNSAAHTASDNAGEGPYAVSDLEADGIGVLMLFSASTLYKYATITPPNLIECTVNFWARAQFDEGDSDEQPDFCPSDDTVTFNAMGTGLGFRVWQKWAEEGPSKGTRITADPLGNIGATRPEFGEIPDDLPDEGHPTCPVGGWRARAGYFVSDWTAIIDWVGMRYCTFETV